MVDGTLPRARRREHRHIKALQRQLLNLRLDRWGALLLALCGTYVAITVLSIIPQVGHRSPNRDWLRYLRCNSKRTVQLQRAVWAAVFDAWLYDPCAFTTLMPTASQFDVPSPRGACIKRIRSADHQLRPEPGTAIPEHRTLDQELSTDLSS
jgi:hypothetical protein